MSYNIRFKTTNNDNAVVTIHTNSSNIELKGGEKPFVIEYDSNQNLYTPFRASGATLQIYGDKSLRNLFSNDYLDKKVTLTINDVIKWVGYLVPESFSQDYENTESYLELECVSAVSVLKDLNIDFVGDFVSLQDIINGARTKVNPNAVLHIPDMYNKSLESLNVAVSNFYDEDKEPMKYNKALEAVCYFLGWSLYEDGNNWYFRDIETYTTKTKNLSDVPSTGINNNLTIVSGYSKLTVLASDYEVDNKEIYPELKYYDIYDNSSSYQKLEDGVLYMKEVIQSNEFTPIAYNNNYEVTTRDGGRNTIGGELIRRVNYKTDDIPNKLDWENAIQIKLNNGVYLDDTPMNITAYPILEQRNKTNIVVDSDYYIGLNFQLQFTDKKDGYVLSTPNEDKKTTLNDDTIKFRYSLKIGDKYYNSVSENWGDNLSINEVLTTKTDDTDILYDWVGAKDEFSYMDKVEDLSGHKIYINQILCGDVEMVIYSPYLRNGVYYYDVPYAFIKDVELSIQKKSVSSSNSPKDTKYTGEVKGSLITEAEDVEFTITSKNNSELSKSKCYDGISVIDTITHSTLGTDKPEKLYIKRYLNQYNTPRYIITQDLKPILNPTDVIYDSHSNLNFLVCGGIWDIRYNTFNYTLIEIK